MDLCLPILGGFQLKLIMLSTVRRHHSPYITCETDVKNYQPPRSLKAKYHGHTPFPRDFSSPIKKSLRDVLIWILLVFLSLWWYFDLDVLLEYIHLSITQLIYSAYIINELSKNIPYNTFLAFGKSTKLSFEANTAAKRELFFFSNSPATSSHYIAPIAAASLSSPYPPAGKHNGIPRRFVCTRVGDESEFSSWKPDGRAWHSIISFAKFHWPSSSLRWQYAPIFFFTGGSSRTLGMIDDGLVVFRVVHVKVS